MPLTGLACPPSAPTFGEAHEFEHCITRCKDRCMSPFLIAAMASSNSKNHHKGLYISATSLKGCVRKLFLERRGPDYAQEPGKIFYGFRGTVMHSVVEEAAEWKDSSGKSLIDRGFIVEFRMAVGFCFEHGTFDLPDDLDSSAPDSWPKDLNCPCSKGIEPTLDDYAQYVAHRTAAGVEPMGGDEWMEMIRSENPHCTWFVLGGTLDGGEPGTFEKETGTLWMTLHDLKTMMEYAADKLIFGDTDATLHTHTKDDYVIQMNLYRYLAERSRPPKSLRERGVKQIKFREARIQGFSMGKAPYMGTSYWGRKHHKHPMGKHFIPPVEFFDDAWVEEYIRTYGRPIYETLLTNSRQAEVCAPERNKTGDHSWLCAFCAFKDSDFCPDPKAEWALMQQGSTPAEAFEIASRSRRMLPVLEESDVSLSL